MSHKHNCSCDHENVKYCNCCRLVYCVGCNQEWQTRNTWIYSYPYYSGTVSTDGPNQAIPAADPVYRETFITCKHSDGETS